MKQFFKDYGLVIAIILTLSNSIAYGLSDYFDYLKMVCILLPLSTVVYLKFFLEEEVPVVNNEVDKLLETMDTTIQEQQEVIRDYEDIFDSQLVELPCVCGGNTFKGLFSPNTDNIVTCEKCKNEYRVTVSYDSVLIAKPMDQNG